MLWPQTGQFFGGGFFAVAAGMFHDYDIVEGHTGLIRSVTSSMPIRAKIMRSHEDG
jgi:hypothetical protein